MHSCMLIRFFILLCFQGKYHKKLAQEADERASLRIFADRWVDSLDVKEYAIMRNLKALFI